MAGPFSFLVRKLWPWGERVTVADVGEAVLALTEEVEEMAGELEALQAQVAANTAAIEAAVAKLTAPPPAAGVDPAALVGLTATLAADDEKLKAATG